MRGIWPDECSKSVPRQVDFREAEHDPPEVIKGIRDMSKERMILEDDRWSNRRDGSMIVATRDERQCWKGREDKESILSWTGYRLRRETGCEHEAK